MATSTYQYGGQTAVTVTFDAAVTPAARVLSPTGALTRPTPVGTGVANQYRIYVERRTAGTWTARVYDVYGTASVDVLWYVLPDPTGESAGDDPAVVNIVFFAGTLTATTTAAALGATRASSEVLVQADPDNTVDVFIGDATVQPVQLTPGQAITVLASDIALVFVKTASATAAVNYLVKV